MLLLTLSAIAVCGRAFPAEGVRSAPRPSAAVRTVHVDDRGVMRWEDTGEEVALMGINYNVPFGFTYRAIAYVGASYEQTIDSDLAHFSRLGLDGLRLFLGESQITDMAGNLLDNHHLQLLDYLIARGKERGLYTLLTGILWYGGYPEPNTDDSGFSAKSPRSEQATNPALVEAQRNYYGQLLRHVNRYTGLAYKDEPAILAIELANEPWNPAEGLIRPYIEALASAVRESGCRKPLFYNVSIMTWDGLTRAVSESSVEGCTYGVYPTGLTNGHTLRGNYLQAIHDYPLMHDTRLASKAKFVYEFDPADIGGSYVLPALARSFREGGMQWASNFCYDPLPIASSNCEYYTHFMNLVYAPQKVVSLMIAAEAFRRLPRNESFGRYPENCQFGPFRVSYEDDLSEMVTEREFLYSNHTKTAPPNPASLLRIAGCGSSPTVAYEGTGAYFLDRLEDGVWRLEVYPDAVWTKDPYTLPSVDREVARAIWREWPIHISLPDLGEAYSAEALNEGNSLRARAKNGQVSIHPGVYLVRKKGVTPRRWKADAPWRYGRLGDFVAPPGSAKLPAVVHEPYQEWAAGRPYRVVAQVASTERPERVVLHLRTKGPDSARAIPMEQVSGYEYAAVVPSDLTEGDPISYCISVEENERALTFPAGLEGTPGGVEAAASKDVAVYVPDKDTELPTVLHGEAGSVSCIEGSAPGRTAVRIASPDGEKAGSVTVEVPLGDDAQSSGVSPLPWCGETDLEVRAKSLTPGPQELDMGLVRKDGSINTVRYTLTHEWQEQRVSLRNLSFAEGCWAVIWQVNPETLSALRFSLHGGVGASGGDGPCAAVIERVAFVPEREWWTVPVAAKGSPIALFDAGRDENELLSTGWRHGRGYYQESAPGMSDGRRAVRFGIEEFGWVGQALSIARMWGHGLEERRPDLMESSAIRVRVRATQASTSRAEVSLLEKDGSAWGASVYLTTDWQEICLALSELRPVQRAALPVGFVPEHVFWRGWPAGRGGSDDHVRLEQVEGIQVSIGQPIYEKNARGPHGFELESIDLVCTADRNS